MKSKEEAYKKAYAAYCLKMVEYKSTIEPDFNKVSNYLAFKHAFKAAIDSVLELNS